MQHLKVSTSYPNNTCTLFRGLKLMSYNVYEKTFTSYIHHDFIPTVLYVCNDVSEEIKYVKILIIYFIITAIVTVDLGFSIGLDFFFLSQ